MYCAVSVQMQDINYRQEQVAVTDALQRSSCDADLTSLVGTWKNVNSLLALKEMRVLHFAGHGRTLVDTGSHVALEYFELVAPDKWGLASWKPSADVVLRMIAGVTPKVACFMSCTSKDLAEECQRRKVPHIVYTNAEIGDLSCVQFVDGFYSNLLKGESVQNSFDIAKGCVEHEEDARAFALTGDSSTHTVRASQRRLVVIDASCLTFVAGVRIRARGCAAACPGTSDVCTVSTATHQNAGSSYGCLQACAIERALANNYWTA